MSRNENTIKIIRYKVDPKQSDALAEIKRLSNQAKNKNKSSINLINIKDSLDNNTEKNTEINKNLSKENNDANIFQRRKHQFITQLSKPSIANEVKRKANLKKWKGLFDNDDNENNELNEENSDKKKNKNNKHVDFTINYNNKKGVTSNNTPYYSNKTFDVNNRNNIKVNDEENANPINRKRKTSSDEREAISQRIIVYLDNPKDSSALAKIKRISNQAKKNKTSNDLIHINPDELINSPEDKGTKDKPGQTFKRRKFQFATTVYVPKKNNLTLLDELHKYKNEKDNNNEEKESGSENDESEDSIFNLDKLDKEESKEQKEVNRNINNKEKALLMERYKKIEPKNERVKYSSNTVNVSKINKYQNRINDYSDRASLSFNAISEEYKKENNLTVEHINTKELIIKNEYGNRTKGKKDLKTYKIEYIWDKNINRLIEKRIYLDENELSNNNKNTKYNNNTFNPFSKYKNDFETKDNENNVTKEKIELDKEEKEKDNIVKENKITISRKDKYFSHLNTTNTFRTVKNVNNNKESLNQKNETSSKPSYRVYQKRQVIPAKEELKENNPQKNRTEIYDKEENSNYMKRLPEKEFIGRKKIYTRITPNPQIKSEKNKKNDEVKFKKIIQPYFSKNNNTKKKPIRLNMYPGETEGSLTDRNNNENNNIYSYYMKSQRTKTLNENKANSELIEDLEKIEQYSVNTYLRKDLLEIYNTIDKDKDFKKGVFNTNLKRLEKKMGEFDNKDDVLKKKKKFDVNNLCKGKTTSDDIYKKYKKRAIKIERGTYNN